MKKTLSRLSDSVMLIGDLTEDLLDEVFNAHQPDNTVIVVLQQR